MIAVGQNIMPLKSTGTKYLTVILPISSLAFLTLCDKKTESREVAFYAYMNFYSQSHFSRFVKNMLEVSPTEYRNNFQHLLM